MSSLKFMSLKDVDFNTIAEAFSKAFADYQVQISREGFKAMLQRRGFVPELSFAAFTDNGIAGFTLNGAGEFQSRKTAYDTGTGTLPEFRGRGIASEIFEYSIPYLKAAGIEQYLLEVLQNNSKAVSIYKKLGFKESREFDYYVKKTDDLEISSGNVSPEYKIKKIEYSDLIRNVETVAFFDFSPSWQNSFDSVKRQKDAFLIHAAFLGESIIGYSVLEPDTGDLTQIAVKREFRRKGVGSALFYESLKHNRRDQFKIINTQSDCPSIREFISNLGIELSGRQYEMIKTL